MKTIVTLTPMRLTDVVVHDLATVALDLAALAHDYHRLNASERRTAQ